MSSVTVVTGPIGRITAMLAALVVLEMMLVAVFLLNGIGMWVAAAIHLSVLLAFTVVCRATFREDITILALALLLTMFSGPVGAIAALGLFVILAGSEVSFSDLEDWYRRIGGVAERNDAVTLYQKIVDGRARRPELHSIDQFQSILRDGSLASKQALLGLIGLSYHRDYQTLLAQALISSEPSIRVHAAAVSVKLRSRVRGELQQLNTAAAACTSKDELLSNAEKFWALSNSGLFNETECETSRNAALALSKRAIGLKPDDERSWNLYHELLAALQRWQELQQSLTDRKFSQSNRALRMQVLMKLKRSKELHAWLKCTGAADLSQLSRRIEHVG
jgi:hypothetical protein